MSTENKDLVRRGVEAINAEGPAAVDRFFAPDWVGWDSRDGTKQSREDFKKELSVILAGFPDARTTIEDLIAEGDRVVSRMIFTGTQTKDYFGVSPTGKRVSISAIDIDRIANGKIVESWTESSGQGFYYQLTGKPAPSLKEAAPK
jgi:predicted ester cyclase